MVAVMVQFKCPYCSTQQKPRRSSQLTTQGVLLSLLFVVLSIVGILLGFNGMMNALWLTIFGFAFFIGSLMFARSTVTTCSGCDIKLG